MKGQIGIEFITVFLLVFIIFLFIQANIIYTSNNLSQRSALVDASQITQQAATLINLASHSAAFTAPISLPPFLLGGFSYNFSVANSSVYIVWRDSRGSQSVVRQLNAFNVTNATGASGFTLSPGVHYIRRNNQGVLVT